MLRRNLFPLTTSQAGSTVARRKAIDGLDCKGLATDAIIEKAGVFVNGKRFRRGSILIRSTHLACTR
eukprot:325407-Prorocentrum_minimum.AAC.1